MCDENIEIGVTEITNNILVSAQPTDQIIDINVLEEVENVELTITPSVVEVNIDVTQELITEIVTVDANTCVNIVDVTVTDATDNVTLNITPSLVEVNINRGENNLSIEEYESFADLPTIGDTDTYYITLDDNKFWRWDSIDEIYVEISDSNDKIPYLGAYKNSDLGEWGIKSNWFGLDLTPTNPPTVAGTITWNDTDGTADLILKGGNVTLQIGQEQVVRVVNKTGATLNEADFRAVRVRSVSEGGAQGQRLAVLLAMADSDADSATTIGIVTESISDNQEGFITTSGEVKKINTTGAKSYLGAETWVDGDILYLSPTYAGYLTNVKPQAPDHTIIIGWVVYAHANNGKIFVKVDNGYELDELHNVKITTPTNNQGLVYDSALSVWKNASIQLPLSATSPLSIASNVLSITKADATTDGYLSSADWNYFSAKQQPLFGTGFVKATGSVISYDNTVYTPQSRTLTINGTAYDLSADRSWSISVGSGMRNVSSFVATSGQTTFTIIGGYTAGLVDVYVNGARLNGGDYTATNGTTVVLATGVVANDIVDIINYTASLTSGLTGAGTTNYIPKWSGSSNLTNSLIYDNGSIVGINTSTPIAGSALTVSGQVYSQNGAFWTEDGQGFLIGDLNAGASYAFISGVGSTGAASYLTFYTNYTERVRIIANGNVGIGLTNPAYKLDVVGDVNITGSFRINGVAIGGGSGTVTSVAASVPTGFSISGSPITTSGTLAITFSAGYSLPTTASQTNWDTAYSNRITSLTTSGSSGASTLISNVLNIPNYTLAGLGGVPTSRTLTINGVSYDLSADRSWTVSGGGGIIGTGTTNYLTKWTTSLTVGDSKFYDNGTSGAFGNTANGSGYALEFNNNAGQPRIDFVENGVYTGAVKSYNSALWLSNNSANPVIIGTSGTERVRILSDGRVAINTSGTIFNSRFQVYQTTPGNVMAHFYDTSADSGFYWYAYSNQIVIEARSSSGATYKDMVFQVYGGNFGIRTGTTALSYTLQVNGTVAGVGGYVNWSDARLKKDVKPLQDSLKNILNLNGITYNWDKKIDPTLNLDDDNHIGLLAQDVEKILPQVVSTAKDKFGTKAIAYSDLVPVLIEAIKELNAKIEAK
jgi:hypothetical protein